MPEQKQEEQKQEQCPKCKSLDIVQPTSKEKVLRCDNCHFTGAKKDFIELPIVDFTAVLEDLKTKLKADGWEVLTETGSNGTEILNLTKGITLLHISIKDLDEEEYMDME